MDLYFKIKEQRESIEAPVDYVGCASMGRNQEDRKFYVLVGLLLSSQTKDEITFKAVENLERKLGVLTPLNVLKTSREEIHRCIEKVGYHNKKTNFLFEISEKVKFKMPETLEETLALPGIGKKMAYLYLYHACGRNEGIGVDTHVHRISNRIGLVNSKTEEQTRLALEQIFDKDEWQMINKVFVGFGQTICKPVHPKCNQCCISNLCSFSKSKRVT